ncbi:MAG: hypothetical protein AAF215_23470 [Cyanobacteria bacterium P01_A01_bin.123]
MKPAESSTYFALEFDLSEKKQRVGSNRRKWLGAIAQRMLKAATGSCEPKIQAYTTPQGTLTWHVYDPVSGDRQVLESEDAVRVWIEQRYNR